MTLYHVCKNWDGSYLESLYEQHGNDAYDMYLVKFPESGNLGEYHTHYIHLYNDLGSATEHKNNYGGDVLEIDAADLDVEIDGLEFDHPVCTGIIAKELITKLA